MKCRINLLVGFVFILAAGWATTRSPLMEAASKGDTHKVQALLAQGADVNAKTNAGGTALTMAKKKGHKEIVRMLKEVGARE